MSTAAQQVTGFVRPELEHLIVPIDEVAGYPGNARRGDLDRIKASLAQHGQYKPLLVQKSSGHVVVGNNTLACMRELGWTHVAVLRLDVDDERARNMLLVDNRTSDDAEYDKGALAELLAGVVDWDAAGWTPDDLDDLLAELGDAGQLDLDALAEAPNTPPQVLDEIPATDAAYNEDPAAEAARADKLAGQQPRYTKGLKEMILLLPDDDHAEATRLITAGKEWLGAATTSGQIMLRALRTLAALGDSRHEPHSTVSVAALLAAAGWDSEP